MAPKKKQPPPNAFFYFMLELKNQQGRSVKSMKEAADVAGPLWHKMSKEQRRPYEEMAKQEKQNMRMSKFTSTGRDVEMVQAEEEAQQQQIFSMKEHVKRDLSALYEAETLTRTLFFVIHVNNFIYCEREDRWYPAEIAVCAFTLLDGVLQPNNVFHRMVKPGDLPLGYASEAKLIAEETHQIERPVGDENNCEEVFRELMIFLETRSKGRKIIVYAHEDKMQMVTNVLEMWCADYGVPLEKINVFNLQYFLTVLKNKCAGQAVWPSDTFSHRELDKDVYDYSPGISCEFHELAGVQVHCSKSRVIRACYIICDNCLEYLNIRPIKGCHVPLDAKTSRFIPESDTASTVSSKRTATESKEDDSSTVKSYGRSDWETQSNSSMLDDFPTLGSGRVRMPTVSDTWEKYSPNPNELSSQTSYASAMGRSGLSNRPSTLPSSIISGVDSLSVTDSDSEFPSLGRGRGVAAARARSGLIGRGRGSAYDRRNQAK